MLHTDMGYKDMTSVYVVSHYMVNSKLDPLRYICEKPYLSSRIARWQVLLAEYDIVYMTRKAVKGSVIADHLADHAMEDYE